MTLSVEAPPSAGTMTGIRLLGRRESPDAAWAAAAAGGHLALAPGWHQAIQAAYGHRPLYLQAGDQGILPAFLVRRPLLGTLVTSMPFLDAGGPHAASPELSRLLATRLCEEARSLGAAQVELRACAPVDLPVPPSLAKVTLVLPLPADADVLWRRLDAKIRNEVRKAERAGLAAVEGRQELLDDFYRVFAINMRDLGSPVHGRRFFQAILDAFGPAARLIVVRKGSQPLAGLVALVGGDTFSVPWVSALRAYAALRPNMLLYWTALRAACRDGLARFDFGRSTQGSGTYRFKRQWDAEEVPLYWYTLPLGGRVTRVGPDETPFALMAKLWRRLPVGLTRILGPRIRGRLTQ